MRDVILDRKNTESRERDKAEDMFLYELEHSKRVATSVKAASTSRTNLRGGQQISIVRSWQRCLTRYGLEPHAIPAPNILSLAELKACRDADEDLLAAIQGELDRLFTQVAESYYVITITNHSGIVISSRYLGRLENDVQRVGIIPGSRWLEEEQGTNGVGTCLKERRPLSVIMGEHFGTRLIGLSCTVAPMFRSRGGILGVINVTTPRQTDHLVQSMVRQIVMNSARRIENLHLQREYAGKRILRLSRYDDFSDLANEARLVLDDENCVLAGTPSAFQLLSVPRDAMTGSPIAESLGLKTVPDSAKVLNLRHPSNDGSRLYVRMIGPDESRFVNPKRPAAGRVSDPTSKSEPYSLLLGEAKEVAEQVRKAQRLLASGLPILLQGETGTGKSALAQALHRAGPRRDKPFIAINCTAVPQELMESELFGYRAGAFTGAARHGNKGLVREADGGTLFLDEIGDMPLLLQSRFLHVLSEGTVTPLGGGSMQSVDISVISASLHDLQRLVDTGRFRPDLFFRLSGAIVTLPSLRDRPDFVRIIEDFFQDEAMRNGRPDLQLSSAAVAALAAYSWPGNLRELRHAARHAVAMTDGEEIFPCHLPSSVFRVLPLVQATSPAKSKSRCDKSCLEAALLRTGWNVSAAARILGISRSTLHRRVPTAVLRQASREAGSTK